VQRNAMEVWQTGEDFCSLVERDPDIRGYLQPREVARAFSLERQLRHLEEVFRRVFGKSGNGAKGETRGRAKGRVGKSGKES